MQALWLQPGRYTTRIPLALRMSWTLYYLMQFHGGVDCTKLMKCPHSHCFFAPILTRFTMSFLPGVSISFWRLTAVRQWLYCPRKHLFGYIYLFGLKDFQKGFNWACSLSGCQDCQWPKAIRALLLFTMATRQMTELTWQGLETEKRRKELILLEDQTTDCLGGEGAGRGKQC